MDKNKENNNLKSRNEIEILKEKQEENSARGSTDLTEQNMVEDVQKNDINLSLTKNKLKKKSHYYQKGNVYMFFFDKNSIPRIVIGPHCKA